ICDWLEEKEINKIDRLIHNAGIGYYGPPEDEAASHIVDLLQTNLKSPIAITWDLLNKVEAARGRVVFVSSVLSVMPGADLASYNASKAALDGFARSLAAEMGERVEVQVLHPGATQTPMHAKVGLPKEKIDYTRFPAAAGVAEEMVKAIEGRNRLHVTIGTSNKLLRSVGRSAGRLVEWGMRRQQEDKSRAGNMVAPTALVTGSADGIGRALTLKLARAGYSVIGVDIDETKGEALNYALNGRFSFIKADLTSAADIQHVIERVKEIGPLEFLVNNAGISAVGQFEEIPLDRQLKVVDLNLTAPLLLTTGLLKAGLLLPGHRVTYISSLSYYVGYPGAAVYAASKDGLSSFAASMHAARRLGGYSTTVYPGPVRTDHARRYSPDNSREDRRMSPDELAEIVVRGLESGRRTIWPGGGAKLFALTGTLFPKLAEGMMKRVIFDKLDGEVLQ
ncbi:MAG: SDR family NAD(P)-dependent oxidoreductase, partial [Chloroflexota bacterium]